MKNSRDDISWDEVGEDPDVCPVCGQEFTGVCPINSSLCPYRDEVDEELDDDDPDFDDVENIDALIDDDEELEKLITESGPLPGDELDDFSEGEAEEKPADDEETGR